MIDIIMLVRNTYAQAMETYDDIYRQMGPRDRFIIADHGSSDGLSDQSIHDDSRLIYVRTKAKTNPTWFINDIVKNYVRHNHFVLVGALCDVPFDYLENLKEYLPGKRFSVLLGRVDHFAAPRRKEKTVDPRVINGYQDIEDVDVDNIIINKGDFLKYGGFDNRLSLQSATMLFCERMARMTKKIEYTDEFYVIKRKKPKKIKKDSNLKRAIKELDENRYVYKNHETGEIDGVNTTVIMLDKTDDEQVKLVRNQIVRGDKLIFSSQSAKPGRKLKEIIRDMDRLYIVVSDKSKFKHDNFIDDFKLYSQYGVLVADGDSGPYPIHIKKPNGNQSAIFLGKHFPIDKITEFMDWKEILRIIALEYKEKPDVFLPRVKMKKVAPTKKSPLGGVKPGGKSKKKPRQIISKPHKQSWYDWMEGDD
jgi:hypothetical protein